MQTPSGAAPPQRGPGQLAGWGEAQSTRMSLRLLLLFLLALAGLASASAQSLSPGGPVDFGGVPVGTTSASQPSSSPFRP